ncbi:preprotein translocase subunit SecA [Candidatus Giovannonibacteria bacterium]|nr:preprotein translocase subunit SecA [Candidatus Giovannonibacteria bacterium]
MFSVFSKIFGGGNERYITSLMPLVAEINSFGAEYQKLSDDELCGLTAEFKARLEKGDTLDGLLPEAFAAVREAARRVLGQRHFDVQLIGGIVLHQGKVAEMRTGEGKTLVATLPLYLNALVGKGAHLVTPNDYLSRIGAGWMGSVYHALGLSAAVITHDMSGIYDPQYNDPQNHADPRLNHFRPVERGAAYRADITYGTNNEFGFDYLRDNLEYEPAQLRQREHYFAIVDEIDSILIDEARTPLIISMPDEESADLYRTFARLTPQLKENIHYNVDEKMKAVSITEEGIDKVESLLGIGNIYEEKGIRFVRHLEQALRAQALFRRDKEYVVKNGEVIIVDEFTGRLMPWRRWSDGLHQAVEAREGVAVQRESRTLATITFQNYFRMYGKLAGMTGTAETSAEEFHKVYTLDVVSIPTHRPMIREDLGDLVFRTEKGKYEAVAREVKVRHEKGQPVLIGTVSIEKNEKLSRMLEVEGVPHKLLNAKNHEQEALIIAQAGQKGAVTVATNMAGRGVDIILGGSQIKMPKDSETLKNMSDDDFNRLIEKSAEEVRSVGGLYVIGTERHEARRIDNQLRGRAGRQGDSGESRFFVSLEDDLMRIFGSDKIKRMMESFGIPEDQPIENKIVSRAIEAAQGKIEGFHFDTRKHVLEYDDVLNKQRDAIYRMRREILFTDNNEYSSSEASSSELDRSKVEKIPLKNRVLEIFSEVAGRMVAVHTAGERGEWDIEEIAENIRAIGSAPEDIREKMAAIRDSETYDEVKREEIKDYITGILSQDYEVKENQIGKEQMYAASRAVMLRSIDMLWMDHLDQMEHLRDSVRLRAYGQRDPLVEYKHEGARLFRELQIAIRAQTAGMILKVTAPPREDRPRVVEMKKEDTPFPIGSSLSVSQTPITGGKTTVAPKEPNRNDPCPCGSGKKYKKCHGA